MTDLVVRGGIVVSSADAEPFVGDVVVEGSRIAAVRPGTEAITADTVVDASGCRPMCTCARR